MNPFETTRLGRTALTVTRLGLGGGPLGGLYDPVTAATAIATVERAHDRGLRLFDTAPLYGSGASERRMGAALRERARDGFTLCTKVGRLLERGAPPEDSQLFEGSSIFKGDPGVNPVFDFTRDGALRSISESLGRMGLARVDVVHVHDPTQHLEEALAGAYPALRELRDQHTIGAVGAGLSRVEPLLRLVREADLDCVLLAGRYTLLDQRALDDLLPLCWMRGVAVLAAGVLNSGILADPRPGARFDYRPAEPATLDRALRLAAVCSRHGVPLQAAAMQFPLGHPAVCAVVVGCRSVEELDEAVTAFEHPIPARLWEDLKDEQLLPEAAPTPSASADT